jgi:hypothetical protein
MVNERDGIPWLKWTLFSLLTVTERQKDELTQFRLRVRLAMQLWPSLTGESDSGSELMTWCNNCYWMVTLWRQINPNVPVPLDDAEVCLTHPLTRSLTHSLNLPHVHSLIYSITHTFTRLLTHPLTRSLTHLLTPSLTNLHTLQS